jgi:hypothetical protein
MKPSKNRKPGRANLDREMLEYDAKNAAFHEVGHYLVADHYHLSASIRMWEITVVDFLELKRVRAQMLFDHTSSFRTCAISWGGVVGEILSVDDDFDSGAQLSDEAWDKYELEYSEWSPTDQAGIDACPSQRRRALNTACRIVHARQKELLEIVERATAAILRDRGQEFNWP